MRLVPCLLPARDRRRYGRHVLPRAYADEVAFVGRLLKDLFHSDCPIGDLARLKQLRAAHSHMQSVGNDVRKHAVDEKEKQAMREGMKQEQGRKRSIVPAAASQSVADQRPGAVFWLWSLSPSHLCLQACASIQCIVHMTSHSEQYADAHTPVAVKKRNASQDVGSAKVVRHPHFIVRVSISCVQITRESLPVLSRDVLATARSTV